MSFEDDGIYSGVDQQITINGIHVTVLGDAGSEIFSFMREDTVEGIILQTLVHQCTDHKKELIRTEKPELLICPVTDCPTKVIFKVNL